MGYAVIYSCKVRGSVPYCLLRKIMKEKPVGIPVSQHRLSNFMPELCPHCRSDDLLAINASLGGYHPRGDWIIVDYKVFCNSCNAISEGSAHNRDD